MGRSYAKNTRWTSQKKPAHRTAMDPATVIRLRSTAFFVAINASASDMAKWMQVQLAHGKLPNGKRLFSEALWDEDAMLETYHRLVQDEMGEANGVLIVDETGFAKKGQDSVGGARQYCGSLGKVENCQIGVFAAYASQQGYALVDKRLFLPEAWFSEAYKTRRTKCKVPDEVTWQSKPQLAAAMVQDLYHASVLPFKYIVADCLYGNSPDFWAACEACVGTVAFVATQADTRCWLQPLATTTHT